MAADGTTVLIVEDDTATAQMYALGLKTRGYSVLTASDGDEGLLMTSALLPDIVLLDVDLPGRNGLDVLARLKASEQLRHIPVVIFSNSADSVRTQAERLGATDSVLKADTTPQELARRLSDWLAAIPAFHGAHP